MAGRNRYWLAQKCLKAAREKAGNLINIEILKTFVRIYCGSDEKRCVVPYLELMRDTGLIRETVKGWEILLKEENSTENEQKDISEGSAEGIQTNL